MSTQEDSNTRKSTFAIWAESVRERDENDKKIKVRGGGFYELAARELAKGLKEKDKQTNKKDTQTNKDKQTDQKNTRTDKDKQKDKNTRTNKKDTREDESVQLFEGQTTHPLSEAEKEAFLKKINVISGDKETIQKALLAALERNYRTAARRFVREVNLNYPDALFHIKVVEKLNNPSADGVYDSRSGIIRIPADGVKSKSQQWLSSTLFHEMLHHVQYMHDPRFMSENPVLTDAETKALSFVLDDYQYTPEYTDSAFKNERKWREIVEGKRSRPSWAPAFKCLVPGKEDEAREAYIEEMAMLETQAQYIQDFVQIEQWGKGGKTHLPTPSYRNYASQQYYRQQSYFKKGSYTDDAIRDIIRRNPGLKPEDFKDMYAYDAPKLDNSEYREQREALKNIDKEIQELSPAAKERLASKLPEEFRNKNLEKSKKGLLLLSIPYVLESKELTLEAKKEHIAGVIVRLIEFPGQLPTPERTYAIKQLEKLNGYEMPIVQNTPNLRGRLSDSSQSCEGETLPNGPLPREGHSIA